MNGILMIISIVMASMNSNVYIAKDMFNKTSTINKVKATEYYELHQLEKEFIKSANWFYNDNYESTGEESQEYIIGIYLDFLN